MTEHTVKYQQERIQNALLSQAAGRGLWAMLLGSARAKALPALLIAAALLMAACGSQPGTTSGSTGSTGNTPGAANTPKPAAQPAGTITEFPLPMTGSNPLVITTGPDGNLWFTEYGDKQIGRSTLSGQISEFPIPSGDSPNEITAGPDGNLWFTEFQGNQIGRITPGGQITEFPLPTAQSNPGGITAGPDGNLWFAEFGGLQIGRITPAGQVIEFPLPRKSGTYGSDPSSSLPGRMATSGLQNVAAIRYAPMAR